MELFLLHSLNFFNFIFEGQKGSWQRQTNKHHRKFSTEWFLFNCTCFCYSDRDRKKTLKRSLFTGWNKEEVAQIGQNETEGWGCIANLGNMQTVNNQEQRTAGQAHCQRLQPQGSQRSMKCSWTQSPDLKLQMWNKCMWKWKLFTCC